MHKDILAAIVGRNKAVALGIVEPLHRSGRHVCCSSQRELDGEAVVRRATAMKNPLVAVSLSGSCGAATSGYYVLRRKIYHAVTEPSNPACLTLAPLPGMIVRARGWLWPGGCHGLQNRWPVAQSGRRWVRLPSIPA